MKHKLILVMVVATAGTVSVFAAPPLFEAIGRSDAAQVKSALANGADVNQALKDGLTPLMYAAEETNAVIVKAVLAEGADITAKDRKGWTAIMYGVMYGLPETVELLKKAGGVYTDDLVYASALGNISSVQSFIAKGGNVDLQNETGSTPLTAAVHQGRTAVVKTLLDAGAKIELKNSYDLTPLDEAAMYGHLDILSLLIEKGADVRGSHALSFAVINGNSDTAYQVAKALIEHGADPNRKNEGFLPVIVKAADLNQLATVKLLLDKGADPNVTGGEGMTALICAAGNTNAEMTKLLLDKGADPNVANGYGNTALILAANKGAVEVAKLLLAKGARLSTKNKQGMTALWVARKADNSEIVDLLTNPDATAPDATAKIAPNEQANPSVATSQETENAPSAASSKKPGLLTKAQWRQKVLPIVGAVIPAQSFIAKFGRPDKTQVVGTTAYWYYKCSDGTLQVVLDAQILGMAGQAGIKQVNDYGD